MWILFFDQIPLAITMKSMYASSYTQLSLKFRQLTPDVIFGNHYAVTFAVVLRQFQNAFGIKRFL